MDSLGRKNLHILAITLRKNSQDLLRSLKNSLSELWLHLEKGGTVSLRETTEETIKTKFMITPPDIKVEKVSFNDGMLVLKEPIRINMNNQIWEQECIDITALSEYQRFNKVRTDIVRSCFHWPQGEVINTGISKDKVWDYLNPPQRALLKRSATL